MSKPDFGEAFEDVWTYLDSNHTKRKIVLSRDTKLKLKAHKHKGESYDDVIKRIFSA
jgi:hypothetical protein